MQHAKFSCNEQQIEFLSSYREYGFKDKSAMIRTALDVLRKTLEEKRLKESAELYAEVYEADSDLKALTDVAVQGWPE